MTYQCGIGGGMERLGFTPCEPHIICDGCGATRPIYSKRTYGPQRWFLDGRAAPRWTGGRKPDHTREDWCPDCSAIRRGPCIVIITFGDGSTVRTCERTVATFTTQNGRGPGLRVERTTERCACATTGQCGRTAP